MTDQVDMAWTPEARAQYDAAMRKCQKVLHAMNNATISVEETDGEFESRKRQLQYQYSNLNSTLCSISSEACKPAQEDQRLRSVPRLAKSLLGNPEGARGVEEFKLELASRMEEEESALVSVDVSSLDENDWRHLRAAVKSLISDEDLAEEWLFNIRQGSYFALVGAILPLLADLENITIEDLPYGFIQEEEVSSRWLWHSLKGIAASQHQTTGQLPTTSVFCPKLNSVEIFFADSEGGFQLSQMIPFVSVPSVTRLKAFGCADEEWDGSDLPADLHLDLEEIELLHSSVDAQCIMTLCKMCPKLKKFKYEGGGCCVGDRELIACTLDSLAGDHLEELNLQNDDVLRDIFDHEGNWRVPLPASTLQNLRNLRKLRVPAHMLVGVADEDDSGIVEEEHVTTMLGYETEITPTRVQTRFGTSHKHSIQEDPARVRLNRGAHRLADVLPAKLEELEVFETQREFLTDLEELLERKDELAPCLKTIKLDKHAGHDELKHSVIVEGFGQRGVEVIAPYVRPWHL